MEAKPEYRQPNWILWLLIGVVFIMWMIANFSCTTQRKAVKYMNDHAFAAANYCAEAFPVKESVIYKKSVKTDTLLVQGNPAIIRDTIVQDGVTKIIEKTIPCPPVQVIRENHFDTVTITKETTAKTKSLEITISQLQQQVDKYKPWKPRAIWTWVILTAVVGGYLFLKSRTALITNVVKKLTGKL